MNGPLPSNERPIVSVENFRMNKVRYEAKHTKE